MEIPDSAVERLLDTTPVARLATVAPDGRPHLVPVVFARAGGRLWTPVDAKPKRDGELARVRHLRREPRAALLLDAYDEDWQRLWWLRIDGRAEIVEGAVPPVVAALRAKYPQYESLPVLREPATSIAIEEHARNSWAASPTALAALLE